MTDGEDERPSAPPGAAAPWRDGSLPPAERAAQLLREMTLEEKAAQLHAVWLGASAGNGAEVAPHQDAMAAPGGAPGEPELPISGGLGQLTRPFGTAPVRPEEGRAALARLQRRIMAANRFALPALAHDECLAGFTAWGATVYPVPLAWGASFDPDLVGRMAGQIGRSMRGVGVHQGLAPVLDVTRDARWGRTEETIGEDPYLVATVGTAYVRGLQSCGLIATLKHFAGYSASRGARNLAPAAAGPRERADVLLPPFEAAVRLGGAKSVMHAYNDNDGVPAAADPALLTGLLRGEWGFTGTVVADYFGIAFLETLHGVAASRGEAGALALAAGVDVELPHVDCYGGRLVDAVRRGDVAEDLVDRSALRVLTHKAEFGMLDADWSPDPAPAAPPQESTADPESGSGAAGVDLDPEEHRALARTLAEESAVLLANDGTLPLAGAGRVAVVGPCSDTAEAMLGCYSFPSHVGARHPGSPWPGVAITSVLAALRAELPGAAVTHRAGCSIDGAGTGDIGAAADAAAEADVCVAVLGDRAGLFGRGTSGEGCDAEDLRLPGVQQELLDALVATGTPVVLVLTAGRPYALGGAADRLAAAVQAFFPGEEGGPALAGILSGRVNPSGRLPVAVPRVPGAQPASYIGAPLAHRSDVSSVDPTPLYPFGHGLSYTSFAWEGPVLQGRPDGGGRVAAGTDDEVTVGCTVRNTGERSGTEVVQLYLHDPVARATRPPRRLIGYARVPLGAGAARTVEFTVHTDLAAYTGPDGRRIVDPGDLDLIMAPSAAAEGTALRVRLEGATRTVDRALFSRVRVGEQQ